jgi:hypothetical protein
VIQSDSARLTSQLLAAFAHPETKQSDIPLRTGVILSGYKDDAFTALLQVIVGGSNLASTTWDLGASLLTGGKVRDEISRRATVGTPGVPVVLEREVSLARGPYEVVAVTHDVTSDRIGSRRDEGAMPDLDAEAVTVTQIAVVQGTSGAFLRGGQVDATGFIVRDEADPVLADRPTALLGLVCRRKDEKSRVRVERSLVGETTTRFPPMEIELGEDRCAQFRDVVPAGTLGTGAFRYEVAIARDGKKVAEGSRTFRAVKAGG